MSRFFSFLLAALITAGCVSPHTSSRVALAPEARPQIAVVPVKNRATSDLTWDLEREMTNHLLDELMAEGRFWVSPLNQYEAALEKTKGRDLFGVDLTFANHFSHNDFLVITELVEHDIKPFKGTDFPDLQVLHAPDRHQVLTLAMRLRIVDLRHEEPVVVHQEILDTNWLISPAGTRVDYKAIDPLSSAYLSTPLAKGHRHIASLVSKTIEEAIFCNW